MCNGATAAIIVYHPIIEDRYRQLLLPPLLRRGLSAAARSVEAHDAGRFLAPRARTRRRRRVSRVLLPPAPGRRVPVAGPRPPRRIQAGARVRLGASEWPGWRREGRRF